MTSLYDPMPRVNRSVAVTNNEIIVMNGSLFVDGKDRYFVSVDVPQIECDELGNLIDEQDSIMQKVTEKVELINKIMQQDGSDHGAITVINAPKVRESLQGDYWVIVGSMPTYKFHSMTSAIIAAKALYFKWTGYIILSTDLDIRFNMR